MIDQVDEIEVSFSDQRFVAQESSEQLTAVIRINGNVSRSFDVNVIPSVKNPPSAQGTIYVYRWLIGTQRTPI